MKALELKNGQIIDTKDIKNLIVNGKEKEFDETKILGFAKVVSDSAKKTATIGAVLIDGTKINPSDIKSFYILG